MDYNILYLVLTVLAIHYVADFIFQKHEDAVNKATSFKHLKSHVMWYASIFTLLFSVFTIIPYGLLIQPSISTILPHIIGLCWVYVYITHLITDKYTSKWVKKYFDKNEYHMGFVMIGLDQLIHYTTLFVPIFILL